MTIYENFTIRIIMGKKNKKQQDRRFAIYFYFICALSQDDWKLSRWWMHVNAGVRARKDKDTPGIPLPVCTSRISSRRSRCVQISAANTRALKIRNTWRWNENEEVGSCKKEEAYMYTYPHEGLHVHCINACLCVSVRIYIYTRIYIRGVMMKRMRSRRRMEKKTKESCDERPQSTQHRPWRKLLTNTPGIYYPHGCSLCITFQPFYNHTLKVKG